jgi:hypothetical protein
MRLDSCTDKFSLQLPNTSIQIDGNNYDCLLYEGKGIIFLNIKSRLYKVGDFIIECDEVDNFRIKSVISNDVNLVYLNKYQIIINVYADWINILELIR